MKDPTSLKAHVNFAYSLLHQTHNFPNAIAACQRALKMIDIKVKTGVINSTSESSQTELVRLLSLKTMINDLSGEDEANQVDPYLLVLTEIVKNMDQSREEEGSEDFEAVAESFAIVALKSAL